MPKRHNLRDMVYDEVSLVDRGANQYAHAVISKSYEETPVEDEIYDAYGDSVDLSDLEDGTVLVDDEGNEFTLTDGEVVPVAKAEKEESEEEEDEKPQPKENPFKRKPKKDEKKEDGVSKSVEEISKAFQEATSDLERDEIIAKAFGHMSELEEIAKAAAQAAYEEREARVLNEYVDIAKSYNVGVEAGTLGAAFKEMAEVMSEENFNVIAKALQVGSEAVEKGLFAETGTHGQGSNSDVLNNIDAYLGNTEIEKSFGGNMMEVFDRNPELYDEYLSELRAR